MKSRKKFRKKQRKILLLLKTIKVRKRKILTAKVRMAKRKRRKNPRNKIQGV